MGTRGAYGFYSQGISKISYNHFDSYPTGLGNIMKEYISNRSVDAMTKVFNRIVLVDSEASPSMQDIIQYSKYYNGSVNCGSLDDYYALLRAIQGDLSVYDDPEYVLMIDNQGFMQDSLFCEWAYIINLDTEELEIYEGFQYEWRQGRYALPKDNEEKYQSVFCFADIPLAEVCDVDMEKCEIEIREKYDE